MRLVEPAGDSAGSPRRKPRPRAAEPMVAELEAGLAGPVAAEQMLLAVAEHSLQNVTHHSTASPTRKTFITDYISVFDHFS